MADDVVEDAVAPEAYVLNVTPGDSGVDLSTVTAASIKVLKPTGEEASWSATLTNATASTLTLTYTFTTNDVARPGRYRAYAALTIPSGTVRTRAKEFLVRGKFEV